jgi:uncharacterized membrane protein YphA (DoxX/SURF4 family)
MKLFANIIRILVGIEFIFSGFVKVVDPYGTGLKLQEYFEVFAADLPALSGFFEFFAHNAQALSLIFCATELILGVALLVSFRMKITAWVALGLMTFFTFLTFYSAYFNKVTDCGCFGDFLKLDPWSSFWKNVVAVTLILVIFIYRKKYQSLNISGILVGISTVIAFGIGFYALNYLPPVDFLAYAEGLNIQQQMQPTGVKPKIEYTFFDKDVNDEISAEEFLMDTNRYKYVDSEILNQSELTPKITDYSVSDIEGNDVTESTFEGAKLFIIFKKTDYVSDSQIEEISALENSFGKDNAEVKPMLLTSLVSSQFEGFRKSSNLSSPVYNIDEKVLKTMARTNPCVILLENGTIKKKWGKGNLPSSNDVQAALSK